MKAVTTIAFGLWTTAAAFAQTPPGTEEPPVDPTPPASTQPVVAPQPPQPPAQQVTPKDTPKRPLGLAFGIGAGYTLPTSIETPNTTSARVRFASGLTLEPRLVVQSTSQTRETDVTESDDAARDLTIGTLLRYPLVQRGKYDLLLLGAAFASAQSNDPDGADNKTSTTSLSLGWGLAVDWWISDHWDLSFSATNPIFALSKTSQDQAPPAGDISTTTTSIGAIWNPTISVMIHLYN